MFLFSVSFCTKSSFLPYLIRFGFFALAFTLIVAWCVWFFFLLLFASKSHTHKESERTLVETLEGMCNQNGNYLQLFLLEWKNVKRKMIFSLFVQGEQTHSNSMALFCAHRLPSLRVFHSVQSTFQWLLRITKKIRNLNWVCNPVRVARLWIKRQIKRLKKTTNGKSPLQIKCNERRKKTTHKPTSNAKREKSNRQKCSHLFANSLNLFICFVCHFISPRARFFFSCNYKRKIPRIRLCLL